MEPADSLNLDLVPLPKPRRKRYKKLTKQEIEEDNKATQQFVDAITGVTGSVPGVMRTRARKLGDKKGKRNWPYTHQRLLAKRVAADDCKRVVVCHDPGTGKTFSFMLAVATRHILNGGTRMQVLVSAPKGLLTQWKGVFLDTLRVPEARIHIVKDAKDMTTKEHFDKYDVMLVSRNLLGTMYEKSHEWVKKHHQNEKGAWVSAWDRTPGTEVHPLLQHRFDFYCIDEVHCKRTLLNRHTGAWRLALVHPTPGACVTRQTFATSTRRGPRAARWSRSTARASWACRRRPSWARRRTCRASRWPWTSTQCSRTSRTGTPTAPSAR